MVSSPLSQPIREHHEDFFLGVALGCYDGQVFTDKVTGEPTPMWGTESGEALPDEAWTEDHDMAERCGIDPQCVKYEGLLPAYVPIESLNKLWQEA